MKVALDTENDLVRFAATLAANAPLGMIIYLSGELGAGKTTFTRGFIQAFGYSGKIKSPTYTLIEEYDVADKHIVHVDLYRLHDAEELSYVGFPHEIPAGSIVLIEWPERASSNLPAPDVIVTITHTATGREIELVAHTLLGQQLLT